MDSTHIEYKSCPVCNATQITASLQAKDYTVSNEEFDIWTCNNCSLRFTQHVANEEHIGVYYKSENYISHSDTQKGFINAVYHKVRKQTLKNKFALIQSYLSQQQQHKHLLDIGAGTGAFAGYCKQQGWQVTALEPDADAVAIAAKKNNINLLPSQNLWHLPSQQFSSITLWHVLEHVHQLKPYFEQFKRLLQPQGTLFIAVPNYTSYDAAYYKSYWAAYDVPRHLYHFSPKSMQALASQFNFEIIAYKPMWFDSVYISLISEKYKNGKSNFIKACITGFLSNLKASFNKQKCSSIIYVLQQKSN